MSHEEMKEKVFALRDGEPVSPEARAEAQRHLEACGECRAAVRSWERSARALFAKPGIEPSEEFTRAVLRRVRSAEEPAAWTSRLAAFFPRMLVAGALAAAVALMLAPRRTQAPTAPQTQTEASAAVAVESEDESAYSLLEAETDESGLGTSIEEYFL